MRASGAPFSLRVAGLAWLALFSMDSARPAAAQGPVAAWGFGEGSGAVASDVSGYGNHGSLSGATWTTGKYGSGLAFNGSNALVSVADAASLDLSTGMTLEAWVNPTSTASSWRDVIFKSVDMYYLEGASPKGGAPAAGGTFTGPLYGTGVLPILSWSHLATTYDGATLRLYVNGVQVASRAQTGAIRVSGGTLSIGGNAAFGQYWIGRIDEVRIYNRALSASQIQADMSTPIAQAASPAPPPVTPPATGTTLRWQQPSGSSQVDEFRVYKGPALDQGDLVYAGLPAPDSQGVYSTSVQLDEIAQGIQTYVWLTAANASGESPPSNAKLYPEGCVSATDADCDGVLDADDNCPYWPNPGQEDRGGRNNLLPDGVGDACQCGDVSGDGLITSDDTMIIKRAVARPPRAVMPHPELCDVGGSAGCSGSDAVIIQRALSTPPRAVIVPQCDPALMP
jgi:hypothetical protein